MLEIKPFTEWSATTKTAEPTEQLKEYTDYVRTGYFKSGMLDADTEQEIQTGVVQKAAELGLVSEDEPEEERTTKLTNIYGGKAADPDADARFLLSYYSQGGDFGTGDAWAKESAATLRRYLAVKQVSPERAAEDKELMDVVSSLTSNADDVRSARVAAVDRGEFQMVAVDGEGGRQIYAGAGTNRESISGKLDSLISTGAIRGSDLMQVNEFVRPTGNGKATVADNVRFETFARTLNEMVQKDEDLAGSISSTTRKMKRSKQVVSATAGETAFDAATQVGSAVFSGLGDMVVGGLEAVGAIDLNRPEVKTYSDAASKIKSLDVFREKGYTEDEIERFTNDFLLAAGGTHFRADRPETGIEVNSLGNAVISQGLVANKPLFEEALLKKGLSEEQNGRARLQRQYMLESNAPDLKRLILSNDSDGIAAYATAKGQGKSDAQFVEEWVGDKGANYNFYSERLQQFGMASFNAVASIPLGIGALMGDESSAKMLVSLNKETSDREEYARMFGDEFGLITQIINTVPQVATDVLLTVGTGATYAGLKTLVKAGAGAVVRGATRASVAALSKETALAVSKAAAVGGEATVGAALKKTGLNLGMNLTKTESMANLFATSFTRSAGASYGSIYSQLPEHMSHEEKHRNAFGAAIQTGISTGIIVSGMSFLGHGGIEDLATNRFRSATAAEASAKSKGFVALDDLTFKQAKILYQDVATAGKEVTNAAFQKALRANVGGAYKNYVRGVFKGAKAEAFEETLDQAMSIKFEDAALKRNTPLAEQATQLWTAFAIGGAMGAGGSALSQVMQKTTVSDTLRAMDAQVDLYSRISKSLRETNNPMSAAVVERTLNDARAKAAGRRRSEIAASEQVAERKEVSSAVDPNVRPLRSGTTPDPETAPQETGIPATTDLLGDRVGERASVGNYSGTLKVEDDGTVLLVLDDVLEDGTTHMEVGNKLQPVQKTGLSFGRKSLSVLTEDTTDLPAGTPFLTPDSGSKTRFAFPSDVNAVEITLIGGQPVVRIKGAQMVGNPNVRRDLVLTDIGHIDDALRYYKIPRSVLPTATQQVTGEPSNNTLPTPLFDGKTTPQTEAAPKRDRSATPALAARVRMAEKILKSQGVSPETAKKLAPRFAKEAELAVKPEEFRTAVTDLFTKAGGVMPSSVTTYSENAETYVGEGQTAEEAATSVFNAKYANEAARQKANESNAGIGIEPEIAAEQDSEEGSDSAAARTVLGFDADEPLLMALVELSRGDNDAAAVEKISRRFALSDFVAFRNKMREAESIAMRMGDEKAAEREAILNTLSSLASLSDQVRDSAFKAPVVARRKRKAKASPSTTAPTTAAPEVEAKGATLAAAAESSIPKGQEALWGKVKKAALNQGITEAELNGYMEYSAKGNRGGDLSASEDIIYGGFSGIRSKINDAWYAEYGRSIETENEFGTWQFKVANVIKSWTPEVTASTTAPTTAAPEAAPKITAEEATRIATEAFKAGNLLGKGGNANVFTTSDPRYVLRVEKSAWSGKEAVTAENIQLKLVEDKFAGMNFGQAVAEGGGAKLLLKQDGEPAGLDPLKTKPGFEKAAADNIAPFRESLERTANMPQEAYDNLMGELLALEAMGYAIDPSKSNNILVDPETGKFNIVDVNDGKGVTSNNVDSILVMLLANGNSNSFRVYRESLKSTYRTIFDKVMLAGEKAGMDLTLSGSGEMSATLAGVDVNTSAAAPKAAPKAAPEAAPDPYQLVDNLRDEMMNLPESFIFETVDGRELTLESLAVEAQQLDSRIEKAGGESAVPPSIVDKRNRLRSEINEAQDMIAAETVRIEAEIAAVASDESSNTDESSDTDEKELTDEERAIAELDSLIAAGKEPAVVGKKAAKKAANKARKAEKPPAPTLTEGGFRSPTEEALFTDWAEGGHLVSNLASHGFMAGVVNGVSLSSKKKGQTASYQVEVKRRLFAEVNKRYPFVAVPEGTPTITSKILIPNMTESGSSRVEIPMLTDKDGNPIAGYYTNNPTITAAQLDLNKKVFVPKSVLKDPNYRHNPSIGIDWDFNKQTGSGMVKLVKRWALDSGVAGAGDMSLIGTSEYSPRGFNSNIDRLNLLREPAAQNLTGAGVSPRNRTNLNYEAYMDDMLSEGVVRRVTGLERIDKTDVRHPIGAVQTKYAKLVTKAESDLKSAKLTLDEYADRIAYLNRRLDTDLAEVEANGLLEVDDEGEVTRESGFRDTESILTKNGGMLMRGFNLSEDFADDAMMAAKVSYSLALREYGLAKHIDAAMARAGTTTLDDSRLARVVLGELVGEGANKLRMAEASFLLKSRYGNLEGSEPEVVLANFGRIIHGKLNREFLNGVPQFVSILRGHAKDFAEAERRRGFHNRNRNTISIDAPIVGTDNAFDAMFQLIDDNADVRAAVMAEEKGHLDNLIETLEADDSTYDLLHSVVRDAVAPDLGVNISPEELIDFAGRVLSGPSVALRTKLHNSLARTPAGKLLAKRLVDAGWAPPAGTGGDVSSPTETSEFTPKEREEAVARIVARVAPELESNPITEEMGAAQLAQIASITPDVLRQKDPMDLTDREQEALALFRANRGAELSYKVHLMAKVRKIAFILKKKGFNVPVDSVRLTQASMLRDIRGLAERAGVKVDLDIKLSVSDVVTRSAESARKANRAALAELGIVSGDPASVVAALRDLAETGTLYHRVVAGLLLENQELIRNVNFTIADFDDVRFAGAFMPKSNLVVINLSGYNGRGVMDVILHEYIHAAIHTLITNPKTKAQMAAVQRIALLRKLTAIEVGKLGIETNQFESALSDDTEFMAYALTDPKFMAIIEAATPKGQRSLIRRIIDAILGLFGKQPTPQLSDSIAELIDFARMLSGDHTFNINASRDSATRASETAAGMRELVNTTRKLGKIGGNANVRFTLDDDLDEQFMQFRNDDGLSKLPTSDGWLARDAEFIRIDPSATAATASVMFGGHQASLAPELMEKYPEEMEAIMKKRRWKNLMDASESDFYEIAKDLGYARIVDVGTAIYVEANGALSSKQLAALKDAGIESGVDVIRDNGPDRMERTIYEHKTNGRYFSLRQEAGATGDVAIDPVPEIRGMLPEGIGLEVSDDARGEAFVGKRGSNTIHINPIALANRIAGLSESSARSTLRSLIDHELGHLAVREQFTPAEVARVASELGPDTLQKVAEDYYSSTGLDIQGIRARVEADRASGELTDSDIADEWLRMQVTAAVNGTNYEQDARRLRKIPTLFDAIAKAIQTFISKLESLFTASPTTATAAAISRAERSFRALKSESNPVHVVPDVDSEVSSLTAALEGAPEGDRTAYSLPFYSADGKYVERLAKKFKLYNLPAELRAVIDDRNGLINRVSTVTKHFVRKFAKMRDAAVAGGVSMEDIRTLFGTTASPLTRADLDTIETEVEAYVATIDPATDSGRVLDLTDAKRESLKAATRQRFSNEFRRMQQVAERRVRDAGFGTLVDESIAVRNEINKGKDRIGMDASNDVYLTRAYRFFTTKGWALAAREGGVKSIDGVEVDFEALRNNAAELYRDEVEAAFAKKGVPYSNSEVDAEVLRKLDIYLGALETMNTAVDSKVADGIRKELNRFKPKKDIDETFRDLLGEHSDPLFNAANTLHKVSMLSANEKFREDFARTAIDIGMASVEPKTGYDQVYKKGQESTMGPLAGLWFDPRVAGVLHEVFGAGRAGFDSNSTQLMGKLGRGLSRMTGVAVLASTQMSLGGYWSRNALGGFIFGAAQGMLITPLTKQGRDSVATAASAAFSRLPDDAAKREHILRMVELGVVNDQSQGRVVSDLIHGMVTTPEADLQELIAEIEEARATKDAGGVVARLKQNGKFKGLMNIVGTKYTKFTDVLAAFDGAIDGTFKVYAYHFELKTIEAHFGDTKSPQEKERMAAHKIKLTFPGNSQVVDIVNSFRRSPIANVFLPFSRFKSEVFRTMFNTMPLALEEIQQGGVMRTRGVRRMAGFLATLSALPAVLGTLATLVFRALAGDDEDERVERTLNAEERAALRESLRSWQKGHSLFAQVLKGGKIQTVDMTYALPHSQLTDLVKIVTEGIRTKDSSTVSRLAAYFTTEIIGTQIAATAVDEILTNRDDFGQPIYLETDSSPVQLARMFQHYWGNALKPSGAKLIGKVVRSGEQDRFGILVGEAMGMRPHTETFGDIERKGMRNLKHVLDEAVGVRGKLSSSRSMDDGEVDDIVDRHQDGLDTAQQRLSRFLHTMSDLGSTPDSLYASAKAAKFSDDSIQSAYSGYRVGWKPNKALLQKMFDNVKQGKEQDPMERISSLLRSVDRKTDLHWVTDGS